jgi:hypothetical protein
VGLFSRFTYSTSIFSSEYSSHNPIAACGSLRKTEYPKELEGRSIGGSNKNLKFDIRDFGKVGVRLNHIQTRKQSSKDGKLVVLYLEFH